MTQLPSYFCDPEYDFQFSRWQSFQLLEESKVSLEDYQLIEQDDLTAIQHREETITKKLLHTYHQKWSRSPLTVASNAFTGKTFTHITGDANLFHTLDLFTSDEAPLFITPQPSFDYQGLLFSHHPVTKNKQQLVIVIPEENDYFVIDRRTEQIVEQQGELSDYFSKTERTTLLKDAQQIILKTLSPVAITWQLTDGKITFSQVRPLFFDHLPVTSKSKSNQHLLATGQTVVSGKVRGIPQEDILFAEEITHRDLPKLKHITGLVTASHIRDGQVIKFLKQHMIPTLAYVKKLPAVSRKNPLVLDASQGQLYFEQQLISSTTSMAPHRVTKLYTWNNNPTAISKRKQLDLADGSFYAPDFFWQLNHHSPLTELHKNSKVFINRLEEQLTQCHQRKKLIGYQTTDLSFTNQANQTIRGGLAVLHHPDLYQAEVTAVAQFAQKHHQEVILTTPLVRTVSELLLLIDLTEQINQTHQTNLKLFLQVETPAQIHQLHLFLRPAVKGLIIHADRLARVAHALDLDEPQSHYSFDTSVAKQYLAMITAHVQNSFPVWLRLQNSAHQLVSDALHWGVDAVIVKQPHLPLMHKELITVEQHQFKV